MKYRIVEMKQGSNSRFMPQKSEDGTNWNDMHNSYFFNRAAAEQFIEGFVPQTIIHEYTPSQRRRLLD